MKKSYCVLLEILLTSVVCLILVYLFYFKTKFGLQNGYLPITGAPIQFASAMACVFIPLGCGYTLKDFFKNKFEIE